MKAKYNGLICFIVFALVGIFLVIYGVMLSDKIAGSIQISPPPSISDVKVPDMSVMAYIDFLIPELSDIATGQDAAKKINIGLLGHLEGIQNKQGHPSMETASEKTQINRLPYALTLSFTSPKKKFCMIDNKLYTEKGHLPDGGKILKIETGRVFILKDGKKQWLYPLPG